MSTILFWNQGRKLATLDQVAGLVEEHQVDVVLIAEQPPETSDDDIVDYLNGGATATHGFTAAYRPPQSRISALSRLSSDRFRTIEHDETFPYATFYTIDDCTLVAVHLVSKLHGQESDQLFEAIRLSDLIRQHERKRANDERTILVGDLNMDPFDDRVVSARALHAVLDRRLATEEGSTVRAVRYPFFYNPMWSLWSNGATGPCATYFHNHSSHHINRYWHMFDQVMVRPTLIDALVGVKVLDHVQGQPLCSANGRPDHARTSDHLPIIFTLEAAHA